MLLVVVSTPRKTSMKRTIAITDPILRTVEYTSRSISRRSVNRGKNNNEMVKPGTNNRSKKPKTALKPPNITAMTSISSSQSNV